MSASEVAPIYQRVFEDILKAMGRPDVSVEDVSVVGEGMLSAALTRGLRIKRIALDLECVVDRGQIRTAIEEALGDLSPRPSRRDPTPAAAAPEKRFEEQDRRHQGGASFD